MSAYDLRPFRHALAEVEDLLQERTRRRLERAGGAASGLSARRLEQAMATLEAAAAQVPALPGRLASRLQEVRGLYALHGRDVPTQALDGMYEAVRAGAAEGWSRAGMSSAFLDAPGALTRWRWAATAACLLLAVGAGVLLDARTARQEGPAVHELSDPRDELLLRLDAPASAREGGGRSDGVQPAGLFPRARDRRDLAPGVDGGGGARSGGRAFVVFHTDAHRRIDADRLLDSVGIRLRIVPARPRVSVEREQN